MIGHNGYEAKAKMLKSFAKAVSNGVPLGKNHKYDEGDKRAKEVNASSEEEWKGLTFNVSPEDMDWLHGGLCGLKF